MLRSVSRFSRRTFVRYGVPFLVLIVGGSFGLKEFAQLRYQYSRTKGLKPKEVEEQYGIKMKKTGEVTLETTYETVQQMDIDNWSNKRGPRPWEENMNER